MDGGMTAVDARLSPLFEDRDFGVVLTAPRPRLALDRWLAEEGATVEALAERYPAVLLRGFAVPDEAAFAAARTHLVPAPADYVYRSTPRHSVGEGIMTATEYPAGEEIPLHCENAYQRRWPLRLVFCCLLPAETGGQTPIADMAAVTARLGAPTLEAVAARGICYLRTYRPGFDLDWQTVFQTDDPATVEAFCLANDIDCEWQSDGVLRTGQTCQAAATHPRTGARLWFNQAHLFHASALGEETMQDMLDIFGPDGLPRDARYGDGSPIEPDLLARVRAAHVAEARQFDWQAGDVLIVDNMRVAHGRRPFTGSRRVLVSMGLMSDAAVAESPR